MVVSYCPANSSLSVPWTNHGFDICFFDTLMYSVLGSWCFALGMGQVLFYRKYANRHTEVRLPKNFLFRVQMFSHFGLVSLSVLTPLLRHGVSHGEVYGYEVLDLVSALVTWSMCITLILIERHFQLPSPPGHGHGAILIIAWTLAFIGVNLDFLSLNNREWFYNLDNLAHKMDFSLWTLRYLLTFAAFGVGIKAPGISQSGDYRRSGDDEESLVPPPNGEEGRRSASEGSTWSGFFKKWTTLLPYMWPKKSLALQLRVLVCIVLLAGVRVANVFVPLFYKKIVDAFTPHESTAVEFCWGLILAYVGLKWLQGGGTGGQGILNNLRSYLWISVQQYTTREIQVGLFEHLHSLSLRWHLSRKTGEVLRVMDRGTSSINNLLQYLVFNILPTLIDIVIAVVFFAAAFNIWFGIIVLATMVLYLAMTILVTEWRTKYRRQMNLADNEQRTKAVDSLINFETVKYYGAEQFEIERFRKAVVAYQQEEWKALASLTFLNLLQSVVMNVGLLGGSLYCGYLVSEGDLTVGDYVLFGTYMMQLMVPLNWLGSLYRVIQESFVNMENMLDLMSEEEEVKDLPHALPIVATKGELEFRNVSFAYQPERPILKDISFAAKPGETIALVGPTGSGKSTIIRLLFRFYDVGSGAVLIDGQDVRRVTQASVRRAIGVVPQDTVLFNDTIKYNIEYGQLDSGVNASGTTVEEAAAHADIHDKILTFPDGYDTKVGERGLKLSGGEKQRVAIARTLLKNPLVVLLDEATSALDTNTERNIQKSLHEVCRGRTTLIVAHRLSTVTHADCILVLKDGEIVERGRHDELLSREGGEYASMWEQQSNKNEGATSEDEESQTESKGAVPKKKKKEEEKGKDPRAMNV